MLTLVLTTETGEKREVVTTEDHPFWSETDQEFQRADQLSAGELVLTADGGTMEVHAILTEEVTYGPAWNLTVQGPHTYHVLTDPDRGPPARGRGAIVGDSTSILVHNCNGIPHSGGIWGQLRPSGAGHQVNHMPQHAATPLTRYNGPAIRMTTEDHAQVASTGSSASARRWLSNQRQLVDSGRIDEAMMNDIDDVVARFPGKYNNSIAEMIGKLPGNAAYQELRTVPRMVYVQPTLW